MKFLKNYPFLLMIIISTIVIIIIGHLGKNSIYSDYAASFKTPQLAAVFEGIGKGKYPWMMTLQRRIDKKNHSLQQVEKHNGESVLVTLVTDPADKTNGEASNSLNETGSGKHIKTAEGSATDTSSGGDESDKSDKKQTVKKTNTNETAGKDKRDKKDIEVISKNNDSIHKPTQDMSKNKSGDKDNSNSIINMEAADDKVNSDIKEETKDSKDSKAAEIDKDEDKASNLSTQEKTDTGIFEKVKENYFDDALFIGDSRTVGLSEYSTLKNSTFYADVGLTIYDIFERQIADLDGSKVTIPEALKAKQFKKIYIMVGINELGTGTTETFVDEYKKVIDEIQKLQPNSIIFIEGIMNVGKEKSDTDPIFNNINIKDKNDHIAQLADNKSIFFIDVNETITDKSGYLPSKYTFDNIHLKAAYYKIWTEFLTNHGIEIN
jgi:hypothetical protein